MRQIAEAATTDGRRCRNAQLRAAEGSLVLRPTMIAAHTDVDL